jgi:hypothetical protein
LLWRDHSSISQTSYNITICGISPYAFYKQMRLRGIVADDQSHLVTGLDRALKDWDPRGHAGSVFKVTKIAESVVSEIANPAFEGFSDWEADRIVLSVRAEPVYCEFWGLPGNFVRYLTAHPAVRKHRGLLFNNGRSDWRDPRIGIALLDSFLVQDAFQDGNVRCSDCFRLGVGIGLDALLRMNRQQSEAANNVIQCRFLWNFYRLAGLLEEVNLLTGAAKNVAGPETPYVLSNDPTKKPAKKNTSFMEWLRKEFFQGSVPHSLFFDIGVQGAFFFDEAISQTLSFTDRDKIIEPMAPLLRLAIVIVFGLLAQLRLEGGLLDQHKNAQRILLAALGLRAVPKAKDISKTADELFPTKIANAWKHVLPIANMLIDSVFHDHADTAPTKPDWDWLYQGIREMYRRGDKYPAVHLLANGTIVTGPIEEPGVGAMRQINDTEKEVIFCDHSKGLMVVINTTWEELKSGKHFAVAE